MIKPVMLPNGAEIDIVEGSDFILNEIWHEKIYDIDYVIKAGDIVFDLGANQGIFSIYAASKGASVFACEPVPRNFAVLAGNIAKTGLPVKAYEQALTSSGEPVSMYLPVSETLCPTGMGSTVKGSITSLQEKIPLSEVLEITVASQRLDEWIIQTGADHIDLMKIDTEGAEIDILETCDPVQMAKVRNLVMETHRGYEEKHLVRILQGFGFTILRYEPVGGAFGGGALFASRMNTGKTAQEMIVGVAERPAFSFTGETAQFSAVSSFSLQDPDTELTFDWKMDGKSISSDAAVSIPFAEPGHHRIQLSVESSSGLAYSKEFTYWIFDRTSECDRIELGETTSVCSVHAPTHFAVSAKDLPKNWEYKGVVVSGEVVSPCFEVEGYLKHNGTIYPITSWKFEFSFADFPNSKDLEFELFFKEPADIQILWWPSSVIAENEITPFVRCRTEMPKMVTLGQAAAVSCAGSVVGGTAGKAHYLWKVDGSESKVMGKYLKIDTDRCGYTEIELTISTDAVNASSKKKLYVTAGIPKAVSEHLPSDIQIQRTFSSQVQNHFTHSAETETWDIGSVQLVFMFHREGDNIGTFYWENSEISLHGGENRIAVPLMPDRRAHFSIALQEETEANLLLWNSETPVSAAVVQC